MKEIENFPKKSELPKFIILVKIGWLIFFCGFWGGNITFAEIRECSLSCLAASPLDYGLTAMPLVLVLRQEPARRLTIP